MNAENEQSLSAEIHIKHGGMLDNVEDTTRFCFILP
jgi:hypothetical protein